MRASWSVQSMVRSLPALVGHDQQFADRRLQPVDQQGEGFNHGWPS